MLKGFLVQSDIGNTLESDMGNTFKVTERLQCLGGKASFGLGRKSAFSLGAP